MADPRPAAQSAASSSLRTPHPASTCPHCLHGAPPRLPNRARRQVAPPRARLPILRRRLRLPSTPRAVPPAQQARPAAPARRSTRWLPPLTTHESLRVAHTWKAPGRGEQKQRRGDSASQGVRLRETQRLDAHFTHCTIGSCPPYPLPAEAPYPPAGGAPARAHRRPRSTGESARHFVIAAALERPPRVHRPHHAPCPPLPRCGSS